MRSVWAAAVVSVLVIAASCGLQSSSPEEPRGATLPDTAPQTSTTSSPTPETTPFLPGASAQDPTPPSPRPPPPDDLDRGALLIGIDDARGASRLRAAVADAELLEQVLLERGFPSKNVTVLLDEEASREGILAAITELGNTTSPEGRAVFAFAGHTRRRGGENHIVAADGRTISAGTLSEALSSVRAPMWIALPTCYAAGFAHPGIVGPNRVATFASSANERSFESTGLGHSFLFEYMVKRGMDAKQTSVEQAFRSAKRGLERDYPRYVPVMDDRFPGEFLLGRRSPSEPRNQGRSVQPGQEEDTPSRSSPRPSSPPDNQPDGEDPPNDDPDDDGDDRQRKKGIADWKACGYPSFGNCDRSEDDG